MGIKNSIPKMTNYGNRGMSLEEDINITNNYYRQQDIAVIYKKPTPITITKVDYPNRKEAVIKEAYFKTPSTTDYNGIYRGQYLDFEAKETKLNRFPLQNIHSHQITHLKQIIKHGGIGFFIIRFLKNNETYLLEGNALFEFIEKNKQKSIPISYFQEKGYLLKMKLNPRIDYLQVIDQIYFKGGSYETITKK